MILVGFLFVPLALELIGLIVLLRHSVVLLRDLSHERILMLVLALHRKVVLIVEIVLLGVSLSTHLAILVLIAVLKRLLIHLTWVACILRRNIGVSER